MSARGPLTLMVVLVGLTAAPARSDVRAAGAVLDKYAAAVKELAGVLKGVKDKATATAARDRVARLAGVMTECRDELGKLKVTEAEQKELGGRVQKEVAPFDAEFVRLSLVPEAFEVFADLAVFREMADSYELEAKLRALKIDVTLTGYWIKHRKYPDDLKEGFQGLDRDPPKDPWGREYKYDPAGPRNRAIDPKAGRPDIWTTSPYGGGKRLLGNWEEKK